MVYLGIHVRRNALDLRETLEGKAELYPATWAAFLVLEKAIAEEIPADRPKRKRGQGKPRRCTLTKAELIRRLQHQLAYTRLARRRAEAKLKDAAQGKEEGKVQWMRVPWLVRVCLAQPLTSSRALAQARSDFIGSSGGRKGVGCSRFTISRITDSFAEVCKEENAKAHWPRQHPLGSGPGLGCSSRSSRWREGRKCEGDSEGGRSHRPLFCGTTQVQP